MPADGRAQDGEGNLTDQHIGASQFTGRLFLEQPCGHDLRLLIIVNLLAARDGDRHPDYLKPHVSLPAFFHLPIYCSAWEAPLPYQAPGQGAGTFLAVSSSASRDSAER